MEIDCIYLASTRAMASLSLANLLNVCCRGAARGEPIVRPECSTIDSRVVEGLAFCARVHSVHASKITIK